MSLPPCTALATTGWSDSCRAGFAPARKARLSTAHARNRLSSTRTIGDDHNLFLYNMLWLITTGRVSLLICENERDSVGPNGMPADELWVVKEERRGRNRAIFRPPRAVSPAQPHTRQPVNGISAWSSAVRVAVLVHRLPPSGERVGEGVHDLGGLVGHGAGVAFGEPGDRLPVLATPRGRRGPGLGARCARERRGRARRARGGERAIGSRKRPPV